MRRVGVPAGIGMAPSTVPCGGQGCDAFRGRRQAYAEGPLNAEPEERSASSADPV